MSRRHHGGRPHRPGGHARSPIAPTTAAPNDTPRPPAPDAPIAEPAIRLDHPTIVEAPVASAVAAPVAPPVATVAPPIAYPPRQGEPRRGGPDGESVGMPAGCTAPQLRRFIKSRPYVPMHELRRRFGINGQEDDVTPVDLADGRIYVGLPAREGGLLGELLRGGEVGYELSLDPRSPIVVGLYPMRPVPRS
jgi:hypothetical protein